MFAKRFRSELTLVLTLHSAHACGLERMVRILSKQVAYKFGIVGGVGLDPTKIIFGVRLLETTLTYGPGLGPSRPPPGA